MPNFRENRECIAYAHRKGFINDRQFLLLYDANTSKNHDFPYWKYDRFDLDELGMTSAKLNSDFTKMTFSSLLNIFSYQMRLLLTTA